MISTVRFVPGLTMISEAGSSKDKSQGSTLNPPYCTGTCSGDMYLYSTQFFNIWVWMVVERLNKQTNETTEKNKSFECLLEKSFGWSWRTSKHQLALWSWCHERTNHCVKQKVPPGNIDEGLKIWPASSSSWNVTSPSSFLSVDDAVSVSVTFGGWCSVTAVSGGIVSVAFSVVSVFLRWESRWRHSESGGDRFFCHFFCNFCCLALWFWVYYYKGERQKVSLKCWSTKKYIGHAYRTGFFVVSEDFKKTVVVGLLTKKRKVINFSPVSNFRLQIWTLVCNLETGRNPMTLTNTFHLFDGGKKEKESKRPDNSTWNITFVCFF